MARLTAVIAMMAIVCFGCTDRKDSNPLTQGNNAPTLEIIGFEADTLVYVKGKAYTFQFIAQDEAKKSPTVEAKAVGNTGTVNIIDRTASNRYVAVFVPSDRGEHTIEISISDGLETTSGTTTLFLGDNQNPVAAIRYQVVERDVANSRFTYEFDASASHDRDSQIIKARWNLNGSHIEGNVKAKFQHTFTYYDNYQIGLAVEDEFGGYDSTATTIDNARPVASFAIRPGDQTTNGQQITLDATGSFSPHGDIETYMWFQRNGSQEFNIIVQTAGSIYRFDVNMPVGDNQIGLLVSDTEGNASDTTWAALHVQNQAPIVDFAFSTELQRIVITRNESMDADPNDTITMKWLIDGTEQTDKQGERLPSFDIRGDDYEVTLVATDNHGQASSVTKLVSVPGVPEADFVFPNGVTDDFETPNTPTLALDGRSSIPGNESVGIETYTWLLRSESKATQTLSTGTSGVLQFTVNYPVGDYQIGLKITNLEGLESVTKWKNLSIINSPPTADFQCHFQAFVEGIVYRIINNNSSDPDPDDTMSFQWFLDDVEQPNVTSPTPTFTRSHTEPVTTILLRVTDSYNGVGERALVGECSGS